MEKYERFQEICNKLDIKIIEVGKDHLDQKIGYLLNIDGYKENENLNEVSEDEFNFDFTLYNGFEDQELFNLLDTLREAKASVQHKAGITKNNVKWTLRELLTENDREAKMMGLIHRINALLDKAENLEKEYGKDESLHKLCEEVMEYFNNSSLFELDLAKKYYLKLLDETLRVEKENQ